MGNVNMEAKQIHDRTEAGKHQSVADHLKALDAIAATIEDMPAYTSSDRAWLDEWENKLPELPADPETDGVKVLTATTTSGATVKSWEEPAIGSLNYSTTEQNTGQKWIDDSDIYAQVIDLENDVSVGTSWTVTTVLSGNRNMCVNARFISSNGNLRMQPSVSFAEEYIRLQYMYGNDSGRYLIIYYTKTTT